MLGKHVSRFHSFHMKGVHFTQFEPEDLTYRVLTFMLAYNKVVLNPEALRWSLREIECQLVFLG